MGMRHFDVVIVGAAATGSSIAYFLTANADFDGSVALIEMDASFSHSATALSSSSIRHQFSNAINVQMSQFGSKFLREFDQTMQTSESTSDVCFRENGYLFLGATDDQVEQLQASHRIQESCNADVVLWSRSELAYAFPHLRVDDIQIASYGCSGEGWFSNTALMNGFRGKAILQGAELVIDEVVHLETVDNKVRSVTLASGERIGCDYLVNASGTRACAVANMAGLQIPVEPRKRSVFVFSCERTPQGTARVNNGLLPLMIDPSGIYCRPEGECFLAGGEPELDVPVALDDFEPDYGEYERIWSVLATRSEYFESIRMINAWAGHYDYNELDQNGIVGPHNKVDNFVFANGFSGHGLQQSPAIGRGISEWLVYGQYRELDLSPLGFGRIEKRAPLPEVAII